MVTGTNGERDKKEGANTMTSQEMNDLWERHMAAEFADCSVDATMQTMTEKPMVNHVPVMTGGYGADDVRRFYESHFIPKMPPDTNVTPVSRTIGSDRIVDEIIFSFTHTIEMDWMLPGIAPTHRAVKVPLVVVVGFRDDRVETEHIYWDQASVLLQIGLLDGTKLPICGVDQAEKILDPTRPSNKLMKSRV